MEQNTELKLSEKIDRAKDGRSQKWIVKQMVEAGIEITEVKFSRKKTGEEDFTDKELKALSKILKTKLTD